MFEQRIAKAGDARYDAGAFFRHHFDGDDVKVIDSAEVESCSRCNTHALVRTAEPFQQWLERIENVTAADVRRVASALFRRENVVACAVGPLSGVEPKLRAAAESGL